MIKYELPLQASMKGRKNCGGWANDLLRDCSGLLVTEKAGGCRLVDGKEGRIRSLLKCLLIYIAADKYSSLLTGMRNK